MELRNHTHRRAPFPTDEESTATKTGIGRSSIPHRTLRLPGALPVTTSGGVVATLANEMDSPLPSLATRCPACTTIMRLWVIFLAGVPLALAQPFSFGVNGGVP